MGRVEDHACDLTKHEHQHEAVEEAVEEHQEHDQDHHIDDVDDDALKPGHDTTRVFERGCQWSVASLPVLIM